MKSAPTKDLVNMNTNVLNRLPGIAQLQKPPNIQIQKAGADSGIFAKVTTRF